MTLIKGTAVVVEFRPKMLNLEGTGSFCALKPSFDLNALVRISKRPANMDQECCNGIY